MQDRMSTNRALLDALGRETLVRLMRERDLAPTRENDERRRSLAHSFHGDVEALVLALTRQELVDVFKGYTFDIRGVESFVSNPAKYRLPELQAFAIRAFAGRRVRIPAAFTRVSSEEENPVDEDEDGTDDDSATEADVAGEVSVAEALGISSREWSRPRQLSRVFDALGHELVQRLRRERFQDLIVELLEGGVEACLADDLSSTPCTAEDESPGIDAKVRLRLLDGRAAREGATGGEQDRAEDADRVASVLENAEAPMRARDIARELGIARTRVNAALYDNIGGRFVKDQAFTWSVRRRNEVKRSPSEGGPHIVVHAGEKPIPARAARPSDYNLAVLRLQFLTAVPSVERRTLPSWPDGYLDAATRGLTLHPQERALLRTYAAGRCIGNHSPYESIPHLASVLSATEWETLLDDFQALNPFQPDLVQAIVEQVLPVVTPRSSTGAWRGVMPTPPDEVRAPEKAPAATAMNSPQSDPLPPPPGPANQRDLGALAGMFDEE